MNCIGVFFFFNDTATTEIYTLSLHDALPISRGGSGFRSAAAIDSAGTCRKRRRGSPIHPGQELRSRPKRPPERLLSGAALRSEEHTSELQSRQYLVCRLLLEKKI